MHHGHMPWQASAVCRLFVTEADCDETTQFRMDFSLWLDSPS